jgi:hypothetical protein
MVGPFHIFRLENSLFPPLRKIYKILGLSPELYFKNMGSKVNKIVKPA